MIHYDNNDNRSDQYNWSSYGQDMSGFIPPGIILAAGLRAIADPLSSISSAFERSPFGHVRSQHVTRVEDKEGQIEGSSIVADLSPKGG